MSFFQTENRIFKKKNTTQFSQRASITAPEIAQADQKAQSYFFKLKMISLAQFQDKNFRLKLFDLELSLLHNKISA